MREVSVIRNGKYAIDGVKVILVKKGQKLNLTDKQAQRMIDLTWAECVHEGKKEEPKAAPAKQVALENTSEAVSVGKENTSKKKKTGLVEKSKNKSNK